jgi:hypothetical protein
MNVLHGNVSSEIEKVAGVGGSQRAVARSLASEARLRGVSAAPASTRREWKRAHADDWRARGSQSGTSLGGRCVVGVPTGRAPTTTCSGLCLLTRQMGG